MPTLLRPCTPNSLDTLRQVSIDTFTETFGQQNTKQNLADYIEKAFSTNTLLAELENPESKFFLAMADGQAIGYLKLNVGHAQTERENDNALEIERIYVRERFKGHGLGKAMVEQAISEASHQGLTKIWLGVWEHNSAARRFYEHFGFQVTGSHTFALGNDNQTDLIMELDLSE